MNEQESSQKTSLIQRKKMLLYVLGIMAIIISGAMILAPSLIKNYINKNGKELAGRTINIEKIKYNYFTSTLKVQGFKYFEKNGSDLFLSFDSFMVNMKPLRLLKNEIYVQELKMVNSNANIFQNDTIFNFDDLLTFFESSESETENKEKKESKSYKLNLHNLELKNGDLHYTDLKVDNTIKLEQVSFAIPQIVWSKRDSSKADVEFKLADGGDFASSFNYNADLGEYSGYVQIDQLETKAFLPYIQQNIELSDLNGTVSAFVNFNGLVSDINQFSFNGELELDKLEAFDKMENEVLEGEKIRVVFKKSYPILNQINIDSVSISEPYIYLALEDSMFNFEKMLVSGNEDDLEQDYVQQNADEEINGNVVLNHFIISNGLMDFSDQTMNEDFNYELSEIKVNMDTISLNDNWVNLNANMKLNKRGTLEAQLGLNPSDPFSKIELNYVLTDFQLPDVNIYSKHYVGLPILFGDMYYVSKTTIINRQLNSENELIIRNVEMGRKTGGLYDIPIKLALFILKDVNGDIVLDIPVNGDLSDPEVKVGKIVWDTFKGFIFKIVASPFKAMGNMINANPEDLEEIAFDYADTTLTNKHIKSLDLLFQLEQEKPEFLIELCYLNDKKLEEYDAASQIVLEQYYQKSGRRTNFRSKEYLDFLKNETGKDSLLVQDYEVLLAPSEEVKQMVQERESMRMYLLNRFIEARGDSTNIRIKGYNENEVLNIGSRPRFEVRLTLAEDYEEQ